MGVVLVAADAAVYVDSFLVQNVLELKSKHAFASFRHGLVRLESLGNHLMCNLAHQ